MCAEGICKSIVSVVKTLFEQSHPELGRRILPSHQQTTMVSGTCGEFTHFLSETCDVTDVISNVENSIEKKSEKFN